VRDGRNLVKVPMFQDTIIDNLLAIVGAYRKATGKSLTSISKEFYGRGDFFAELRKGKHTVSIDKLDAMLDNFRAKWPEDAMWPSTRTVLMTRNPQK
jgi:hypothetical protein